MTALAQSRARKIETWKHKQFTLASGKVAYKGGIACLDPTSATATKVIPGAAADGLIVIGKFDEDMDATSAAKLVNVDLERELQLEWMINATSTDAVAATDIGRTCYILDDQTVTITRAGHSVAGVVWAVDTTKGVLVEKSGASPTFALAPQPAVGAYAANDFAPTTVVNGSVNDVPTTGAASTITLPAAAPDGTSLQFAADGTKNGHTVQYRDATGPTNLTTALTASKRHLVVATKLGGKWFANAYVSP